MAVLHWVSLKPRSDSELLSLKKFSTVFPDRLLTKVTRQDIDEALTKFCQTTGTYMRYRTMIAAVLNAAKEQGWLREVPRLIVRKDRKKRKAYEWLQPEQWQKLLAELPTHMKPMASFAIQTGLRQANVLGLRWSQVDLKRKLVWVEAEDAKGDESISVPLSADALRTLKSVKGQHDEFVFVYRGAPIKEIKTAFIAACVRASVGQYNGQGRYEGFTWHGFRHTWATWHVQRGTPLDVLQKLGAWKDPRMVAVYAHHSPGYLRQFVGNARL